MFICAFSHCSGFKGIKYNRMERKIDHMLWPCIRKQIGCQRN